MGSGRKLGQQLRLDGVFPRLGPKSERLGSLSGGTSLFRSMVQPKPHATKSNEPQQLLAHERIPHIRKLEENLGFVRELVQQLESIPTDGWAAERLEVAENIKATFFANSDPSSDGSAINNVWDASSGSGSSAGSNPATSSRYPLMRSALISAVLQGLGKSSSAALFRQALERCHGSITSALEEMYGPMQFRRRPTIASMNNNTQCLQTSPHSTAVHGKWTEVMNAPSSREQEVVSHGYGKDVRIKDMWLLMGKKQNGFVYEWIVEGFLELVKVGAP